MRAAKALSGGGLGVEVLSAGQPYEGSAGPFDKCVVSLGDCWYSYMY